MRMAVRAAMSSDRFVRLVGRRRSTGVDAALDRQVAAALEFQRIARLPALDSMTPIAARKFAAEGLSPTDLDHLQMAEVIDTAAGAVPIRIFVPPNAGPDWLVYFHGGGGVIGSVTGSEPVTRYLAAHTRCKVASVDYRLAPEHKHPAGLEDAFAAWDAIVARVPAGAKIAVGGDSFGGYVAAHIDRKARRKPDLQVLIYPLLDLTMSSPSIGLYSDGYLLTKSMIQWFHNHYVSPDADLYADSPWFWPELTGASPAIVITAGFDPLVDEGNAWAERLRAVGTPVRHRFHPSLIHGFLALAGAVRTARGAVDQMCTDIVDMLGA